MRLAGGPGNQYAVNDVRAPYQGYPTTYFFNVGADTQPPSAAAHPACAKYTAPSGAFQIENIGGGAAEQCYTVAGPSGLGWNFSLYDATKPARGVSMTMLNGDNAFCPGRPRQNRTFTLSLLCAPMPVGTLSTSASVFELNACDYRMELKSIAGCPTECTASSGSICSGSGVCGYDTDGRRSRCYCFSNAVGATCSGTVSVASGLSAEGVILIVVCLVLTAVIGLVVFMFVKLRKLQVDPNAYSALENRFNELGMLAT